MDFSYKTFHIDLDENHAKEKQQQMTSITLLPRLFSSLDSAAATAR